MDYHAELLGMVQRLVRGEWDVPPFERAFYMFYVDDVPEGALEDRDLEFFGLLQERLDWTEADPGPESRAYGWQNHEEYRASASEFLARFHSGGPLNVWPREQPG